MPAGSGLGIESMNSAPLFRTTLIDPPWMERGGGKSVRGAQRHYPLLPTPKILDVVLSSPFNPHENAHLYLWVTDNFLPDGLWLMGELGFAYKRTFQWVKVKEAASRDLHYGIGQYARGAHEMMLFGVRGRGQHPDVYTDRRDIPSVFFSPVERQNGRRVHSRKPDAAYSVIESRSKGPYLELFARSERPGWVSWGNQLPVAQKT